MNISHKQMLRITAQSQHKNLFRAVLRQGDFDFETLQQISNHGIDGGFSGFIYWNETIPFYNRNKRAILALAYEMINECGIDGIGQFLAGFGCLKGYSASDCEQALMSNNDDTQVIKNALTWFAAEEAARFIVDSVEG